ncbi:MAG: UDP-N-acetylmuramoyl-L-alanyl-D-glutamate--2,6-diaminopimelate ligase [Acidobacteriota bacterium]|nr:UDP-N-acetylmuramoyl-L-alanyl-D-glutamate--2,6-diaminopimelate ligase [Acidobacteriota bacterium]
MQLGDLLDQMTLDAATGRLEVSDVQIDSRRCGPGSLFFALSGTQEHGSRFAADAVERGAVAVVSDRELDLGVPVLVVAPTMLRATMAEASAAIVGHPELGLDLVGVTGTNGKTTVTTLIAQLARALGWGGASLGTLTQERTTPDAPELARALADAAAAMDGAPRRIVSLEVSSHALDQGRVEGLRFAVAAFTNLGHDHLDYHGTMEAYYEAKASLFTAERARRAVVWVDDPYGARLAASTALGVTRVARTDALEAVTSLHGSTFFWRGQLVSTPLVGGYNVDNALVALAVMADLGADPSDLAAAMAQVRGVPGRFEVVGSGEVTVIVDYAHTPDGLERLLGDVRELTTGQVLVVFGCGGQRDRAKRPVMGEVAARLADVAVVTSDNPRGEDPEAIIDEVLAGTTAGPGVAWRESDRGAAIARALETARAGDVVVIAGKGHESTQDFGDRVVPFSDRDVARELVGQRC